MPNEVDLALDAELASAGNPAANLSVANAEPAAQSAPSTSIQPPTTTPAAPPQAAQTQPQDPNATPVAAQTAAEQYQNARDYAARALGYQNASQYPDDSAFLQAMIASQQTYQQQLADARQMEQYGRMWLAQQQQAQQPQTPVADPLARYKAPEWNPAWLQQITKTAEGGLGVVPGADPAILQKYLAYEQHRRDTADKMLSDPVGYLSPLIEAKAQELATKIAQQQVGSFREQQYVSGFMQQNAGWLYNLDSTGRPIYNPATNQPTLSQAGQRFTQHLLSAANMGMPAQAQEQYARAMLMSEMAQPQQQQQQAVQAGDALKQQALQQFNRRPNSGGVTNPTTPPDQSHLSLAEKMIAALRGAGHTEESMQRLAPPMPV